MGAFISEHKINNVAITRTCHPLLGALCTRGFLLVAANLPTTADGATFGRLPAVDHDNLKRQRLAVDHPGLATKVDGKV